MKSKTILFLLFAFIMMTSAAIAVQVKGAKDMLLFGGKTGSVPFPHHRHQIVLSDCNNCHTLFPQSAGAIKAYQLQKKLKKKQVMNQCKSCHKKRENSGQKAGPVKCKGCHKK